ALFYQRTPKKSTTRCTLSKHQCFRDYDEVLEGQLTVRRPSPSEPCVRNQKTRSYQTANRLPMSDIELLGTYTAEDSLFGAVA
ncbi:MAG: hypothetical protein ACYCOU_10205, partial [Sulfobacillus sp.]